MYFYEGHRYFSSRKEGTMYQTKSSTSIVTKSPLFPPGIAQTSDNDGINYTTLSYSTGGPDSFHYHVLNDTVVRRNPSLDQTDSFEYEQVAGIRLSENSHGGGDVAVYARGNLHHQAEQPFNYEDPQSLK